MRTTSGFNQSAETGFTKKPKPATESWWLGKNAEEFYDEARERFPETGSAVVSRGKPFTGGTFTTGFKARASEMRREGRRA